VPGEGERKVPKGGELGKKSREELPSVQTMPYGNRKKMIL